MTLIISHIPAIVQVKKIINGKEYTSIGATEFEAMSNLFTILASLGLYEKGEFINETI